MKKAIIVLTVLMAAVVAWVIAFPENNPLKKLFAKSPGTTPGTQPGYVGGNSYSVNGGQPVNTGWVRPGSFEPPAPVSDKPGFPLSIGSRGFNVELLQRGLNNNYGSDLDEDGIFGNKTAKAVSAHGFNPDAVTFSDFKEITRGIY